MSERELFEKEFKKFSHTFNESLCIIPNTDRYYSNIAQAAWEAWQASANRQGYKLVPVEPNEKMYLAGTQELLSIDLSDIYDTDSVQVYKAMIGAVE